jgi:hypothetical protein
MYCNVWWCPSAGEGGAATSDDTGRCGLAQNFNEPWRGHGVQPEAMQSAPPSVRLVVTGNRYPSVDGPVTQKVVCVGRAHPLQCSRWGGCGAQKRGLFLGSLYRTRRGYGTAGRASVHKHRAAEFWRHATGGRLHVFGARRLAPYHSTVAHHRLRSGPANADVVLRNGTGVHRT